MQTAGFCLPGVGDLRRHQRVLGLWPLGRTASKTTCATAGGETWWSARPSAPTGRPLDLVGLDSSIIQNPKTWEASGHIGGFSDPMVDCRESKRRYRADHLLVYRPKEGADQHLELRARRGQRSGDRQEAQKALAGGRPVTDLFETVSLVDLSFSAYALIVGPDASAPGSLTEPREFNLMFKTFVGATSGEDNVAYLRPETAQGIFLNYKNVLDTSCVKMPFGIAQIGKSFRNEVTLRNFIFRSRDSEQMEMEFFLLTRQRRDLV